MKPTGCPQSWVDTTIFDGDGRLLEFQSTSRDIDQRRRVEQERERLLAAIKQTGDVIIDDVPEASRFLENGGRLVDIFRTEHKQAFGIR